MLTSTGTGATRASGDFLSLPEDEEEEEDEDDDEDEEEEEEDFATALGATAGVGTRDAADF